MVTTFETIIMIALSTLPHPLRLIRILLKTERNGAEADQTGGGGSLASRGDLLQGSGVATNQAEPENTIMLFQKSSMGFPSPGYGNGRYFSRFLLAPFPHLQPRVARWIATPAPIPELAPVTSTAFPGFSFSSENL